MSATSALLRGRQFAEEQMLDTCTVRRRTSESTDPDTGVVTPTWTVVYSGTCKVQQRGTSGTNRDVAEAERLTSTLELHLPYSAPESADVTSDDVATIDTSALDTGLPSVVLTIRGPVHASFKTARRFSVEELTS